MWWRARHDTTRHDTTRHDTTQESSSKFIRLSKPLGKALSSSLFVFTLPFAAVMLMLRLHSDATAVSFSRGVNERAAFTLLLFVVGAFAFQFVSDRVLPNNPSPDPVYRPYHPKNDPPIGKQVPNVPVWTADGKRKSLVSVPRGQQWLLIVFYPSLHQLQLQSPART